MTKVLLVIVVTVLVVLLFKSLGRRSGDKAGRSEVREVEDMVRCRVCGVNLPRSEALMSRGRFYCGEAHRLRDKA